MSEESGGLLGSAMRDALKVKMAEARTVEALFRGLLAVPGLSADPERLREAARKIGEDLRDAAAVAVRELGGGTEFGDPLSGIGAVGSTSLAMLLSWQWRESEGQVEPEKVGALFASLASALPDLPSPDFAEIDDDVSRAMSIAEAGARIYPWIAKADRRAPRLREFFLGRRSVEESIRTLVSEVNGMASELSDEMCRGLRSPGDRLIAWKGVVRNLSSALAADLEGEYYRIGRSVNAAREGGPEARKELLARARAAPEGLLIRNALRHLPRIAKAIYPDIKVGHGSEPEPRGGAS